jgi:hypothetical protein
MPANLLIIDDKNVPRDIVKYPWAKKMIQPQNWIRHVLATNNTYELAAGRNCKELLSDILNLLNEKNGKSFDGTILDIIFSNEPDGGIQLWNALIKAGVRNRLGPLLISTNANYADDPQLMKFAALHAGGRISGDKNEGALRPLCEFLDIIPGANKCNKKSAKKVAKKTVSPPKKQTR